MKIVIDIDKELYNYMRTEEYDRYLDKRFDYQIRLAVANGTSLPKGHGRLGDLDALREEVSSWGMNDYEPSDFIDEIDRAATIIKAESEETE